MTTQLIAFAEGLVMGTVTNAKGGRLSFLYPDEWLASPGPFPLSVSMPLSPDEQGHRKIHPFLWGLRAQLVGATLARSLLAGV
jgi:serine/threonine-protein kinase HipA